MEQGQSRILKILQKCWRFPPHVDEKQKLTWLEQAAVKALVDLWYGKASGSATVMLSMVVIPVSTLWTGLVGGWHGTLALALVGGSSYSGKRVFFFFLVEVG